MLIYFFTTGRRCAEWSKCQGETPSKLGTHIWYPSAELQLHNPASHMLFQYFPSFWVRGELIHCKILEIMTNSATMRNPWTQIMVPKYLFFPIKRTKLPKRNDDSRSGSKNVQDNIRIYCYLSSKEDYRVMSKNLYFNRQHIISAPIGQRTIWALIKLKDWMKHNKYIKSLSVLWY